MTKLRVLVAEDSLLVLMSLEVLLQNQGIEIVGSAANLRQAVALAQATDADFAILDVNLGSEMVFPAAEILRARQIPFLFTTGYSNAPGFPQDFADVRQLLKPYDEAALVQQIAACLGDAQARNETQPATGLDRDFVLDGSLIDPLR
jgi:DNA-binding NarL/FixJ family response regulator